MARDGRTGFSYLWWEITEAHRKDPQAFVLTLVAAALGVGPGWEFWHWARLEYRADLAVLTATLIALIWTANYAYKATKLTREESVATSKRRNSEKASLRYAYYQECVGNVIWLDAVSKNLHRVRNPAKKRPITTQLIAKLDVLHHEEASLVTVVEFSFEHTHAELERMIADAVRERGDVTEVSVADIERISASGVTKFRGEVAALRKTLEAAARMMCPELYNGDDFRPNV